MFKDKKTQHCEDQFATAYLQFQSKVQRKHFVDILQKNPSGLKKYIWKDKGQERGDSPEEVEEGGRGLALQISRTYCKPQQLRHGGGKN